MPSPSPSLSHSKAMAYTPPKDPTLLTTMSYLSQAIPALIAAYKALEPLKATYGLADFAQKDLNRAYLSCEDTMANLVRLQDKLEGTSFASDTPRIIVP